MLNFKTVETKNLNEAAYWLLVFLCDLPVWIVLRSRLSTVRKERIMNTFLSVGR